MDKPVLKADHISKSFGQGHTAVRAVDDVSLAVSPGELVLIMGPSGSGKTTLLSMLGALLHPDTGRIQLGDVDITPLNERQLPRIRAERIGFIFQAFNLLDALNVEENILFPAQLVAGGAAAARPRALELMARLRLAERRHALPRTLSGGEKQRVAIARALINQPALILADEPTGNLDSQSGQEVMMVLYDIARDEGRSIIMVTHDPRVEEVADRVLWLEDGRLQKRRASPHDWTACPVCHMRVDINRMDFAAEHRGHVYRLCSSRCRERFLDDPDAFVSGSIS